MQIRLTPANVNAAIANHLKTMGVDVENQHVTYTYSNKRKSGGVFVDVTIGETPTPVEVGTAVPDTEPTEAIAAPVVLSGSLFG